MTTLTWLGQAGFLLDTDGVRVLLDPWMSDHPDRTRPALPAADFLEDVSLLLVTHEHEDHFDREFVRRVGKSSPGLHLVVPGELAAEAGALVGDARVVPVEIGDALEIEGVRVQVVRADHKLSDGPSPPGCVGYVVSGPEGPSVYHSGDTLLTDELVDSVRAHRVDIALLPANGRDYFRERRGLVGNLTAREVVELAQLLGAGVVVPMHWDADLGNTERVGAVADYAAELDAPLHTMALGRGVPWRIS